MKKTLKTLTLSATLAAAFLSAGAFAGASKNQPQLVKANVTIIHKNSAWPYKGRVVIAACAASRCIDV